MDIKQPENTANILAFAEAPDRLWRQVLNCVDTGKAPSRSPADDLLREGYRFVLRWGEAKEGDWPKLMKRFPALMKAYLYYSNPSMMKWLIEAALLTQEPREDLLKYLGVEDLVLRRYQQYFMDVADKIGTPSYVYSQIIKRLGAGQVIPADQDYLYKILAYQYGWKVLTEYISYGAMSKETIAKLTETANSNMVKHYYGATQVLDVSRHNALEVIQAFHEMKELEQEGKTEEARDWANEIIDNLMSSCNMTVIKSTDTVPALEPRVFNPDEGFVLRMDPLPVKRLETRK